MNLKSDVEVTSDFLFVLRGVAEEDAEFAVSGGHEVIIHVGVGLVPAPVSYTHYVSNKIFP